MCGDDGRGRDAGLGDRCVCVSKNVGLLMRFEWYSLIVGLGVWGWEWMCIRGVGGRVSEI